MGGGFCFAQMQLVNGGGEELPVHSFLVFDAVLHKL